VPSAGAGRSVGGVSHAGRLLVATPLIADPTFERSVVLLLAHGGEGAFGVVLNRPSETAAVELVPDWSPLVSAPGVVFVGGPVGREAVIGIAGRTSGSPRGYSSIVGDLGTVDLHEPPDLLDDAWEGVRLFAGSAGWAAGQLEDEVQEGAWWPVDAEPDDVFSSDPGGLWSRVLRRQAGQLAWFANCPDDPTAN
jgi:putative transcriptional regulator